MVEYSKLAAVEAALRSAQGQYDSDPDTTGPRDIGRVIRDDDAGPEGPNWSVDLSEGISGDPFTFMQAIIAIQNRMPLIDPAEL